VDFNALKTRRASIRTLAEPTVRSLGCDLVGVELATEAGGLILRLFIDKPGGVTVADCTRVSRALSPEFDVEEPVAGAYRLEVSSPGIERPVERQQDFLRFQGFKAKVRMAPDWGRRRLAGVLAGVEGDELLLEAPEGLQRLPFDRIDRVRLDLTTEEFMKMAPPRATEGDPS
jgi:ribosome maturation factor RimP